MKHDVIGLIFGVVCILIGAALLYDGASGRTPVQAETIAGAAVLSFGAVTLGIVLKGWVKWRSELKKYRAG
jgi:hypothetical protein